MVASTWGLLGAVTLAATASVARAGSPPPVPFTDEAMARGIDYVPNQVIQFGEGVAFADLDGDGDADIVVLGDAAGRIGVYENDGTGMFIDRSAGIPGIHSLTSGVTAVDVDRDGDLDLHVTRRSMADRLFRNDGDFTFTEIGGTAGIADTGDGHGAAWADVDGDGWIDLYLCDRDGPNSLFRNLGIGFGGIVSFTDEAVARGVDRGNDPSFAASFFDMDDDGDPDLYLANDHGLGCFGASNHLFRNDGGVFTDVTDDGTEACLDAMCVAVGDFDGDGLQDLFSTNTPSGHALMLNGGDGPWERAEVEAGVAGYAVGWGATFFDFDHDGMLDLHVCHASSTNRLYRNTAKWPTEDVSAAAAVDDPAPTFSSAAGDVDGDGDLDLLVSARNVPIRLLINHTGQQRRWVKFDVIGLGGPAAVTGRAPASAVGTVLRLQAGAVTGVREVRAGTGFKSQDEMRIHFGLNGRSRVDELVVRWPHGGDERTLRNYAASRTWKVWPTERLGDVDDDGDRDPADLAAFAACWTGDQPGSLALGCERLDIDGDADVDEADVLAFVAMGYAGPTGDCDGDGIMDAVAIASGIVLDADGDGLPDGCDAPPLHPADLNADTRVDAADLMILMERWGTPDDAADLDGDGLVGFGDMLMLLATWAP
jgi:hypothetical protein